MAKIACQFKQQIQFLHLIIPRSEDPLQILRDMEAGVKGENYQKYYQIVEKRFSMSLMRRQEGMLFSLLEKDMKRIN